MSESKSELDANWLQQQIQAFRTVRPHYEALASHLRKVLEQGIGPVIPTVIVQTRAKTLSSFAEKSLRKRREYADPVHDLTDLCGARVIVPFASRLQVVCNFIEHAFAVDPVHTDGDVSIRLQPSEFGYRSIHYVVSLRNPALPKGCDELQVPPELLGLKAEIQVRTMLEHAWSDVTHDIAYKGAFAMPKPWRRELAGLAAVLENIDCDFKRIADGLNTYGADCSAYMNEEEMERECGLLQTVLSVDAGNADVAVRLARLLVARGSAHQAVEVLTPFETSGCGVVLAELGRALCHCQAPGSDGYRRGQMTMEKAMARPGVDAKVVAWLAESWEGLEDRKAHELYRKAFEANPSDPQAAGRYLAFDAASRGIADHLGVASPAIDQVIRRCSEWISVRIHLPDAYFDRGLLHLLRSKPYPALYDYADGINIALTAKCIATAEMPIRRLHSVASQLPGWNWIRYLLLLGLAARKGLTTEQERDLLDLASPDRRPVAPEQPIVFLCGACDAASEELVRRHKKVLLEAFAGFRGTLISGGTRAGVSGLAGDIREHCGPAVRLVGYVPRNVEAAAELDPRYDRIFRSGGEGFSPLEPLQAWVDLVASGVDPRRVRVLGVGGGSISAAEYRIALALGATVGLLEGGGGEAQKVVDEEQPRLSRLVQLPVDPWTLQTFLHQRVSAFEPTLREQLAQEIHEDYRQKRRQTVVVSDPSLVEWDRLLEHLKESNRHQAEDMFRKLGSIGCSIHPVRGRAPAVMTFTDDEVEILASMEHARWNVERLLDGWRRGERKDVTRKISPYLVPWADLPPDIKEIDRQAVRAIPRLLANASLEVRRSF